ncbi:hypothetical protein [Deinococcus roseus]|uniref:Uncharacterized protein n=1 Tax=Deinococcus roseus TaxID=392414 RepID=A0ABQ2D6I7_9DEIO|nr:hypothetical protein [Deinococcus roseus]GGJ47634.1 hypothetical protein GCM10008938_37030 [Deinococcus roseus]
MAQANETLFTLVAAFIQAPFCPLGWSLSYSNSQLRTVVERINNGEPLPNVMGEAQVTWETLASAVMEPFSTTGSTSMEEHTQTLVRSLRMLAEHHTDENLKHEYNSIKHGFRASA